MVEQKDISPNTQEVYQNVHERLVTDEGRNVLVSHYGEFSQDLVNSLSEGIEEAMRTRDEKKALIKRMFSILIEGLQNIRIHGVKSPKGKQFSHVIIARNEDNYKVNFGNLIEKGTEENLKKHLTRLNGMDAIQIKQYYMEVLSNGIMSKQGGAGLGFITIAMKSKSQLVFEFKKIDDNYTYFNIEVVLENA